MSDELTSSANVWPIEPDVWNDLTAQQQFAMRQTAQTYGEKIVVDGGLVAELQELVGSRVYDQGLDLLFEGVRGSKTAFAENVLRGADGYSPDDVLDAQLFLLRDSAPTEYRTRTDANGKTETFESKAVPRDVIDPATIPEGTHFTVFGADATIRLDPTDGLVLDIDGVKYGVDELAAIPVERESLRGVTVATQRSVRSERTRMEAKANRLEKRRVVMAENQRLMEETVKRMEDFTPAVYNIEAIMADSGVGFMRAVKAEFRAHDGIIDGKFVTVEQRRVLAEIMMDRDKLNLSAEEIAATYGKAQAEGATPVPTEDILATLTQGDLTPDHIARYRAHEDNYYANAAKGAYESLTSAEESHGVAAALGGQDHLKRRLMTVRYSELEKYLVSDIEVLMNRYNHSVMGRASLSRAITLNPQWWKGTKLLDGSEVKTGGDMVKYVSEVTDAWHRIAQLADGELGRTGRAATAPKMERLRDRVQADLEIPIKLIEGKTIAARQGPVWSAMSYFGRTMLPIEFMNKLGSVAWSQLNDLAPKVIFAMQRPGTLLQIPRIMKGLALGGKSEHQGRWRDLQVFGIGLDQMFRVRAITDINDMNARGFGYGETRRISGGIEEGLQRASDFSGRLSGMDWINNVSKQWDGVTLLDRSVTWGKKVYKVAELTDGGMPLDKAMKAAKIKSWDLERMNFMGFNAQRTRRYLQLVYQHGLTLDDKPVRLAFPSFGEFLNTNKIVKPNFLEWNLTARADVDLLQTLAANMNREVNFHMTVTPGRFDRPLFTARHPVIGNLVNQFQSFGMAFANQRIRPMAQMPLDRQLPYIMNYMLLGGVSDALASHFSGRRSIEETAKLWEEQPLAMMAVGIERSGMLGWLGRYIFAAQGMQIKAAEPGEWRDMSGTSAARHGQPGKLLTYLGPFAGDIDRFFNAMADFANLTPNSNTAYNLHKLLPLQNWVGFRMLNTTTGLNFTPERWVAKKWKRKPPQP